MDDFEIKIVKYFNNSENNIFNKIILFSNSLIFLAFFWIFFVAIAIIKNPSIAEEFIKIIFIISLLHFLITELLLKHLLLFLFPKRKRPYIAYPEKIKTIGKSFSDSSFPSSHVVSTVAMLFIFINFYPSIIFLSIMLVIFMAFSRLRLGMHYPSDIIAGILIGMLYGYVAILIIR